MTISFTICSANYLPYAKSLADSLVQHNPHHKFVIALLDKYNDLDKYLDSFEIIEVDKMNIDQFDSMNNNYNIFELSCAIKPFVTKYFFEHYSNCKNVFYFDSDIFIYDSLKDAETILAEKSVLLTAHFDKTNNLETNEILEQSLLKTGIYNGGFFGVSRSIQGLEFLKWWCQRLAKFCYNDAANGLFVDQLWLNLAPVFFNNIVCFDHKGYNVAYWNLHERELTIKNNKVYINDDLTLVFFHFSGYNLNDELLLSKHFPQYTFEEYQKYKFLFDDYANCVLNNNTNDLFNMQPFYGKKPAPIQSPSVIREKNFFKRKYKKWFLNR